MRCCSPIACLGVESAPSPKTVHTPVVDALAHNLTHRGLVNEKSILFAALRAGVGGRVRARRSRVAEGAGQDRMSSDNMQVDTQISVFNTDGSPDKERRYTVFRASQAPVAGADAEARPRRARRCCCWATILAADAGSQRPLRITPMQKLLGDASTGDIATMSWADDYTGTVAGEERCGAPEQVCVHLSLAASARASPTSASSCGWARRARAGQGLSVRAERQAREPGALRDGPACGVVVTAEPR